MNEMKNETWNKSWKEKWECLSSMFHGIGRKGWREMLRQPELEMQCALGDPSSVPEHAPPTGETTVKI